jgi:hypothetical protein
MSSDFMNVGALSISASSNPLKRAATATDLTPGHARLKQPSGIAGALIDGRHLHPRHRQNVRHRQGQRLVDVPANSQFESRHVHFRWDESPVPAHEELIVGRKDAAVEHVKRRLEQWRPAALQNHPAFLREVGRDATLIRPAG